MPHEIVPAVWEAYRRTTYRVKAGERTYALRVGERHPEFDAWLASQGTRCWAFVTAWNPRSRVLGEEENRERHAALRRMVDERGWLSWPGEGVGEDPSWVPEASLLVAGINREEGKALGRAFEQNAIVWGKVGGLAELVAVE
ncbi:MAG: DUF3293 domain-containing protein [Planctomycetaceae bacterium]|nr:DUF3293 domain-containing protein [Planctomycetaceae bacterium]